MPFNGSGSFSRNFPPGGWQGDAAANIKIKADRHDQHDDDLATGLSNTICRDGQSTVSADIPFNSKKITGLANPVSAQDAATKAYVDAFPNGTTQTLTSTDAGAGQNPYLILDRNSASPAANDYMGGIVFRGRDSTNAATDYATIRSQIVDPLNAAEDGQLIFTTMVAGTSTERLRLGPTGLNTVLGQGTLSFIQKQVKTTTGAITLHADTRTFLVEVVGGGGGSGGCTTAANQAGAAGGGGSGGYAAKWFTRLANQTLTVTIAAGGAAQGSAGQTNYQDTANGLIVYGNGGAGSLNATANLYSYVANGGAGAAHSGGDYGVDGEDGDYGVSHGATATGGGMTVAGGRGGSTPFGRGGGPSGFNGGAGGAQAQAGTGYGSGAGGGGAVGGGSVVSGVAGRPGVCVITEFR